MHLHALRRIACGVLVALVVSSGMVVEVAAAGTTASVVHTQAELTKTLNVAAAIEELPSTVLSPSAAAQDYPSTHGCLINAASSAPIAARPSTATCSFGDVHARAVLALFGDSQMDMWEPDFAAYGVAHHLRVVEFTLGNCDPASLDLWNNTTKAPGVACTAFRSWAIAQIKALDPVAVAFSSFQNLTNYDQKKLTPQQYEAGYLATLDVLKAPGRRFLLMSPIPQPVIAPPLCVSEHPSKVAACGESLATALGTEQQALLEAVARQSGATFVDTNAWMCGASFCPVVADDTIMYYNRYHVSAHWAEDIAPVVTAELARALGASS